MIPVWLVAVLHVLSVISAPVILLWLGVAAWSGRPRRRP